MPATFTVGEARPRLARDGKALSPRLPQESIEIAVPGLSETKGTWGIGTLAKALPRLA